MTFPATPEDKVQRLRNQIAWVTRLSATLGNTDEPEDVLSMILYGVVSPQCLGYSQVLYFHYDSEKNALIGKEALRHESSEAFDELASELAEEIQAAFRTTPVPVDASDMAPQTLQRRALDQLAGGADWITLVQRLEGSHALSEKIRKVRLDMVSDPEKTPPHPLADASFWWRTHALDREVAQGHLPDELLDLLPEHFVGAPLLSRHGIRGLLIVDCRFHNDGCFSDEKLQELDWFTRQASVALDNIQVNHDLSQAYKDLKELDAIKTNFLSIISHELRTPLTAISGFVELLREGRAGELTEMQRTLLSRVSRNTSHLNNLVSDLLEVAQIEAEGMVEVTLETVHPLAVLEETLPRLEQRRRQTETNIHVEQPESGVPEIFTDSRALSRIYFHLLDNALKFSPEGETVVMRFRPRTHHLYIDVVDRGVGIEKESLKYIFQYFYQVDNSLTRGYEGLGLGLAVTRMLVHATHGNIEVHSSPGEGSTFTISFPLALPGQRRDRTPSPSH